MKLWILLDEQASQELVQSEDIVLVNRNGQESKYPNAKVVLMNPNHCNEDPTVAASVNAFFDQMPERYDMLRNSSYMAFFRIIAVTVTYIDEILQENQVDKVVLVGGCNRPFLSSSRTEGEGEKWHYRTSWLLSPLLYSYLSERNQPEVQWIQKESSMKLSFLHGCRENILFTREILAAIKRILQYKKAGSPILKIEKSSGSIVIAPLMLQYRHLSNLLCPVADLNTIYLTNQGNELNPELKNQIIVPISFSRVLMNACRILRSAGIAADYQWKNIKIHFNRNDLRSAMKASWLVSLDITSNYFNTIDKLGIKPEYVITDATFGSNLRQVYKICQEMNIKHINFQYVTMAKMLFPEMNLADCYYLYAMKVFNLYHPYSDSFIPYFPIEKAIPRKQDGTTVVSVFTQPDLYTDRYLCFLESFLSEIKDIPNIRCIIKLHYRQTKVDAFRKLADRYEFAEMAEGSDSVPEILSKSDFAMSMTSSVLFEAFSKGTPGIIIDLDGVDSQLISDNDFAVEEVNFRVRSMDKIHDILQEPDAYREKYYIRREQFIASQNAMTDIGDAFR